MKTPKEIIKWLEKREKRTFTEAKPANGMAEYDKILKDYKRSFIRELIKFIKGK